MDRRIITTPTGEQKMKIKTPCKHQGAVFYENKCLQSWCELKDEHFPSCNNCPKYEENTSYISTTRCENYSSHSIKIIKENNNGTERP